MTLQLAGPGFVYADVRGGLELYAGGHLIRDVMAFEVADAAGSLVEHVLELPDGARVEAATFSLSAAPAGVTEVASVAQARAATVPGSGTQGCVIDFGRLVTVAGVRLGRDAGDLALEGVARWTGADWQAIDSDDPAEFPETSTERLLVTAPSGGDLVEAVTAAGEVRLPARPGSLELLVDGTTVWTDRQGSTPGLEPDLELDADGVAHAIDRTQAVREAFARAPVAGGLRRVAVAVRAAAPGQLQLKPALALLQVHLVQFGADALTHTLRADEEGVRTVALPGPYTAADAVRELALVLRGSYGTDRVQPVEGPPLEDEACLVLVPGRTVLLGLPRLLAGAFGELTGVRLHLRATVGGGEIAGRLLADEDGRAGAPLPGAGLLPAPVGAGTGAWQTLALADAVPVTPGESAVAAWLELALSYGEVECALTASAADTGPAPGAPVARRLPGGGTAALPRLGGFPALHAAVRLVGRPEPGRPLPAVEVGIAGTAVAAAGSPGSDGLPVVLVLPEGVRPTEGSVPLRVRLAAAGTLTVETVRVAYSLGVAS